MPNHRNRIPAPHVQVFELTMDNDEDQDELNRKFRKPGEPPYVPEAGNTKWADGKTQRTPNKRASRRK